MDAIRNAALVTIEAVNDKEELLQLMKDMVKISESGALFANDYDAKYIALRNTITHLTDSEFDRVRDYVVESQVVSKQIRVENVYKLERAIEKSGFAFHIQNQRWLFHGSRISNWVGLLSRGLLLPQGLLCWLPVKFGRSLTSQIISCCQVWRDKERGLWMARKRHLLRQRC